jgi:hypothetical protein
MNVETTLKAMLRAASGAAKNKWNLVKEFAEPEFRTLAEAAKKIAENCARSMAAAVELRTAKARETAIEKAKRRAARGFRGLELAAEGVVLAAEADLKLAAQDAINSALGVLRGAVNEAVGIVLL